MNACVATHRKLAYAATCAAVIAALAAPSASAVTAPPVRVKKHHASKVRRLPVKKAPAAPAMLPIQPGGVGPDPGGTRGHEFSED